MYDVMLFVFPADINECKTGRNTCANDTVCFNLEGGYDCRCPHGHNCTGDCIHDNKVKHSGQIWVLDSDRCSVCSCQVMNRLRHTQRIQRQGKLRGKAKKQTNQEQSNKAEVNGSAETERGRQVKRRGNVSTAVYSRVMISPVSLMRAHFYSMCVQLIQA